MFLHLFRKVYFVDEDNRPLLYPDIKQHELDYSSFRKGYPFLKQFYHDIMFQYKPDGKEDPLVHIFIISKQDWKQAIQDYCNYLGLSYEEYLLLCRHSTFCTEYVDNCGEIISLNHEFPIILKEDYKFKKKQIKSDFQYFPAEYAINCLDKEWARNKYEYFRTYEIYNEIKKLQVQYYNDNMPMPSILHFFCDNDQTAKALIKNPCFKKEVLNFLESKIDITEYLLPIQEYVNKIPSLGYDRFTAFKFNWPLAKHFMKTGYRIDE